VANHQKLNFLTLDDTTMLSEVTKQFFFLLSEVINKQEWSRLDRPHMDDITIVHRQRTCTGGHPGVCW